MRRDRRWVGVLFLSLLLVASYTHDAWADKVYGRDGSCIPDGHGGPNNSGPLRAGSAPQSPQQCVPTREVYNTFPLPHLDLDIDLLLSGNFDATSYPFMDNSRINIYLRSMDADSSNEFHKPRRDFQLVWDYFHGKDSTQYYGKFGLGNPNLDFNYSNVPDAEENHVDIYLNHPSDGLGDQYPYQGPAEPQEDGNPALCDEYNLNTFSHGGGFKSTLGSCGYVSSPDSDWHLSGERASLIAQHEFQHACFRGDSGPGFPNEAFSMAAEYLVGASVRDSHRPLVNTIYDRPLVNVLDSFNAHHYRNWYLWGIYLSQQFAGDTTRIEDDFIYKWVRNKNEFGAMEQSMKGIARVLSGSAYASLGGSTGAERLRNLYHNYVLARWIDNPNPGFHGGRLGFSRGIDPSWTPGYFDKTFAPVGRNSAEVVPPRFLIGPERVASDQTYPIGSVFQVADTLCSGIEVSSDSIGIWMYGSDYLQFDASSYFATNGKANTFRFKMNWDPMNYPGGGSGNSLRVTAISYSVSGDSLYRKGSAVTALNYAFVDSLHGFAQVWVPGFGTTVKAVVIAIDMGEVDPPSSGRNPRKLYYGYSFGVDVATPTAPMPLSLTVARPPGQSYAALQWTDPGSCGTSGYTIQRSTSTLGSFATVATVPAGMSARNDTTASPALTYYRVFATGAPACSSNFASAGGTTSVSQSLGGILYLAGDLTMTGVGRTLTLLPGTHVRCGPNIDNQQSGSDPSRVEVRIVSGAQIQAVGTSADSIRWSSASTSPAPGHWRGVYLQDSGSSPSRFEYNAISHAVHGIHVASSSSPTIDHCAIRHSQFYGVWAFSFSSPKILNSILEQNHGAEIGITGNSGGTVRNSFLRYSPSLGSGAVDDGIVYTVNSGGVFRRNRISGVGLAMYCLNSSSPTLVGQGDSVDSLRFGRNDLLNFRYYGVRTSDEGLPELGSTNQGTNYLAGRNDLFSTSFPSAIWIEHSSTTNQLSAKHNYWGGCTAGWIPIHWEHSRLPESEPVSSPV